MTRTCVSSTGWRPAWPNRTRSSSCRRWPAGAEPRRPPALLRERLESAERGLRRRAVGLVEARRVAERAEALGGAVRRVLPTEPVDAADVPLLAVAGEELERGLQVLRLLLGADLERPAAAAGARVLLLARPPADLGDPGLDARVVRRLELLPDVLDLRDHAP